MQQTHPRIVKVWPNRLAWLRINEERKKKGLEPLPEKGFVPSGAEKEFVVDHGSVISAVPQGFVSLENTDGDVDNSLLDAFPDIRSQGSIGSCCPFAITYYQLTYAVGCMYGYHDNKNVNNNDTKFSPKWTYNMINEGEDRGSNQVEAYAVLERHGAARWSLFPYQGNGADPQNYRQWCLDAQTWRDAISYRIYPFFTYIPATRPPSGNDFDDWLAQIKTLLLNTEVLTFPTYISSWQYTVIKDDPATPDDDRFANKSVAYWVNGSQGGHVMTIVGYNDSIWTDINNNGVVDDGEKGALRIANSWGSGWKDYGFCWLAYDALRGQSAVDGGPSSGRQPALMNYAVWSINVMPHYVPRLLAVFTVWHERRDQLGIALASSNGTVWTPGALQFQGGPYAFDGTKVACEGTFVFDFTDVFDRASASDLYGLWVTDDDNLSNPDSLGRRDRHPAKLLNYGLIDTSTGETSGGLLDAPLQVDAGLDSVSLYHPLYAGPEAVISASTTSGRTPLTVDFYGDDSSYTDEAVFEWDFGDGEGANTGSSPYASHTYVDAGTWTATLTVAQSGVESSDQVVITVTRKKSGR